tara:strand:+ start:758 stop:1099 length:342 start_codon:yes stop_codon:yes gene_type:complete
MALGNSAGQTGGKSRGVIVKRAKERYQARNYTSFNCGPVAANHSNACSGDAIGNTFYHDGVAPFPVADDIVYSIKRAHNPNTFTAGFYKFSDRGRSATVEIDSRGAVLSRTNC